MIYNRTLNDYKKVCSSYTTTIFLIISISISSTLTYCHWYLKRKNTNTKIVFY